MCVECSTQGVNVLLVLIPFVIWVNLVFLIYLLYVGHSKIQQTLYISIIDDILKRPADGSRKIHVYFPFRTKEKQRMAASYKTISLVFMVMCRRAKTVITKHKIQTPKAPYNCTMANISSWIEEAMYKKSRSTTLLKVEHFIEQNYLSSNGIKLSKNV